MGYHTEEFTDKEERDARWKELRKTHAGVIRYSNPGPISLEMGAKWIQKWFVGYPNAPMD